MIVFKKTIFLSLLVILVTCTLLVTLCMVYSFNDLKLLGGITYFHYMYMKLRFCHLKVNQKYKVNKGQERCTRSKFLDLQLKKK